MNSDRDPLYLIPIALAVGALVLSLAAFVVSLVAL